jgi:hypothetical protein
MDFTDLFTYCNVNFTLIWPYLPREFSDTFCWLILFVSLGRHLLSQAQLEIGGDNVCLSPP